MLRIRFLILIAGCLFSLACLAQHPNYQKIDSLKKICLTAQGRQKINCLNALCMEHWWPGSIRTSLDSLTHWASVAHQESLKIHYADGIANALMFFGVVEIYKDNFLSAERYLRRAEHLFDSLHNDFGMGWGNIWLAQSLYSQNNFNEALTRYKKSLFFLERTGDWDGEAKAWAFMGGIYAHLGNYDSSYFYSSESLKIRQNMSDYSCVAYSITNMGHLYRIAGSNEDALNYYRQAYHYAIAHGVDYINTDLIYLEPIGNIYRALNSIDSSYYYLQRAVEIDPGNKINRKQHE